MSEANTKRSLGSGNKINVYAMTVNVNLKKLVVKNAIVKNAIVNVVKNVKNVIVKIVIVNVVNVAI